MSDAQLREFIARALPVPIDGQDAFINAHWQTQGDRTKFWTGRAASDVGRLANDIEWGMKLKDTRDVFVCMSSQSSAEQRTSRTNQPYFTPIRSQQNVVALKSLFLDCDVKPDGKGYADLKEAFTALGKFIADADLPRPTMIVSSGGGIHAHWVLAEALTRERWQPLANALAEATRQHGFKCDTAVTVDSARILRPPETINWKYDPPRKTRFVGVPLEFDYSVERMEQALAPYVGKSAHSSPALPALGQLPAVIAQAIAAAPIANDLAAGIEQRGLIDIDLATTECPFLDEALTTGGKNYQNPLWNMTTLLATFTEGGRDNAHRMADKHPDYDPDTTDMLYSRKEMERTTKNLGWPRCASIQNAGCALCAGCKHLPEGKSPFNFVPRIIQTAGTAVATSDLPDGYQRSPQGLIGKMTLDDTGMQHFLPVVDYPISDPWLQREPEWALNFNAVTHHGPTTQVSVPFEKCTKDAVQKLLQRQGVIVHTFQQKRVLDFLMAWITQLQQKKNSVAQGAPFGWNNDNGAVNGFVFAGQIWGKGGSAAAVTADPLLTKQFAPCGGRAPWDDAVRLITDQGKQELNAILASSFAAPLMVFTGHAGTLMSCFSLASGAGKSTAMKIAQAVWGDPQFMMQLNDTSVSSSKRMGTLHSLPLYWDELKTAVDTENFVNLVFSLTSGREKSRANADLTLRKSETWQTMMISASNASLLDSIAQATKTTTAGIYRIFEYEVPPAEDGAAGVISGADAQRIVGRLNNNYAVIGLAYAKWLGANYDRVDVEMADELRKVHFELHVRPDERFWATTIGCIMLGAKLAKELQFIDFDLDGLREFLYGVLRQMRKHLADTHVDMADPTNVSNILSQYMNAMFAHNTIWTDELWITAGKPPPGRINVKRVPQNLAHVAMHVAINPKMIRLSTTHMAVWLAKQNIPVQAFYRAMMREFGARKMKGRIASGTQYAGGTEYLWEIDLAGSPLVNFIDEA